MSRLNLLSLGRVLFGCWAPLVNLLRDETDLETNMTFFFFF